MASALQDLRKSAGYKTSKEFAALMGIPPTTYSRYEGAPEKIPLKTAWALADKLGCSIDLVVGRASLEAPESGADDLRGPVQRLYDDLSPRLQGSLDDYLRFLVAKNADDARRLEAQEMARMDAMCLRYEHMMWAEPDYDGELGAVDTFGTLDERRAQYRDYVEGLFAEMRADAEDEGEERREGDAAMLEKVMEAWDRTHGAFTYGGMSVSTHTVDMRNPYVAAEVREERGRRQSS